MIDLMNPERHPSLGMDVVILVTSSPQQAAFWSRTLREGAGQSIKHKALLLPVVEEWAGGAGNGLGTLFAYQLACEQAQKVYDIDLPRRQAEGAAVGMYHTAGQGTRLFPLVGAEHNNKAAVRLPFGAHGCCLLEAIIRQTAIYAPGRMGRLSVFWGDQIFIPSQNPPDQSEYHVDVLGKVVATPSSAQWTEQGLHRYGIAVTDGRRSGLLLEKVDYDTFSSFAGSIAKSQVAVSLGSFSLSGPLLKALLQEFEPELSARQGKLDSDPHFWMALTLEKTPYIALMKAKGTPEGDALRHHQRMTNLKQRFMTAEGDSAPLFGVVDIGAESYWWDYGSVTSYQENVHKLVQDGPESDAMRAFFQLDSRQQSNNLGQVDIDAASVVCDCTIQRGTIRNSVLLNVTAESATGQGSVLIDTAATTLDTADALVYSVVEEAQLSLTKGWVRADTFVAEGNQHFKMLSRLDRDGKSDWNERLYDNPLSYAQLYQINQQTNLEEAAELAIKTRQRIGDPKTS